MSNLVKWGTYDAGAAKQEKEDLAKEGGGAFMKLAVGKNVVRILPPAPGRTTPFQVVHQHFVRLPTAPDPVVFVCPRMTVKQPCPVCAQADKLRATGNQADRDKAWELTPRRRVFCAVIDREAPELGPRVLAFGKQIHEELVSLRDDEDSGGDFTHPVNGYDIIIERKGSGKNDTEYKVRRAKNETPLSPDAAEMAEWAEALPDLAQFTRVKALTEILEMLGIDPDAVPERKPAATNKATRQRKAAQTDGGDDDLPY